MTLSWKAGSVLAIALLASACSTPNKSIRFNILDNGRQIEVSKFYNDGFGVDKTEANAFKATQNGDLEGATKMMQSEVALQPNNQWARWDLAVLYEAASQWDKAEAEIKECIRIEPKEKRFHDELAFIENHKAALKRG